MKTKSIAIRETLFAIMALWLVMAAISYFATANAAQKDTEVTQAAFSKGQIVFPIDNVKQDGKDINMTITKNARSLQKKSTAYEYSVMKKVSVDAPQKCPMVNSTAIDKNVKNYNPFTGAADLKVTFITKEMADKVAKADCLLIRDTETEPYTE